MTRRGYNGWKNYETWCVSLWIDNEAPSYRYWRDAAEEAKKEGGKKSEIIGRLATRLHNEIAEGAPELGASMWADLLGAALGEVYWYEIAKNILSE